jgi:hypothetical protein
MRLGLRANIWLVTPKTFEAAKRGDWENCAPCEDKTSVDLDKDWHAIHYLLTGDTKSTFLHTRCGGAPLALVRHICFSADVDF